MKIIDYCGIYSADKYCAITLLNGSIVEACHLAKTGKKGCVVAYYEPVYETNDDGVRSFLKDYYPRTGYWVASWGPLHAFWGDVKIFCYDSEEDARQAAKYLVDQGTKIFDALAYYRDKRG